MAVKCKLEFRAVANLVFDRLHETLSLVKTSKDNLMAVKGRVAKIENQ